MTRTQIETKVRIAREKGEAIMDGGTVLRNHGDGSWAAYTADGNCIDVSKSGPERLLYLFT